jgi:hypothetical protein
MGHDVFHALFVTGTVDDSFEDGDPGTLARLKGGQCISRTFKAGFLTGELTHIKMDELISH